MRKFLFGTMTLLAFFPVSAADPYVVDNTHSGVMFSVDHNNIATFFGRFNEFSGTMNYDEANPASSKFDLTIQMESVDSANARRDKHLRSPDFFNTKQFPTASFKTTGVTANADGSLSVTGDFTLAGKTQPITFAMKVRGPVNGRDGAKVRGFFATAVFKRSDFGITYGNPGVGDEVKITASLEAVLK